MPLLIFHRQAGFTLVELIVTMMVVGIMAVTVLPRFADQDDFEARGYADQLEGLFRYAQKTAIAQRRMVHLDFAPTTPVMTMLTPGSTVCAAGATAVILPATPRVRKSTVTVTPTPSGGAICFDGLGRPSAAVMVQVVGGAVTRTFYVEAETGYVHE